MNRFKKEIRKRGVKLESDYPMIPFNGLEAVIVHADAGIVTEYHDCCGWIETIFDRKMNYNIVMRNL